MSDVSAFSKFIAFTTTLPRLQNSFHISSLIFLSSPLLFPKCSKIVYKVWFLELHFFNVCEIYESESLFEDSIHQLQLWIPTWKPTLRFTSGMRYFGTINFRCKSPAYPQQIPTCKVNMEATRRGRVSWKMTDTVSPTKRIFGSIIWIVWSLSIPCALSISE